MSPPSLLDVTCSALGALSCDRELGRVRGEGGNVPNIGCNHHRGAEQRVSLLVHRVVHCTHASGSSPGSGARDGDSPDQLRSSPALRSFTNPLWTTNLRTASYQRSNPRTSSSHHLPNTGRRERTGRSDSLVESRDCVRDGISVFLVRYASVRSAEKEGRSGLTFIEVSSAVRRRETQRG